MAVSYKSQQANLPLIVVAGSGPSLLGRNWLSSIQLDWKTVQFADWVAPFVPVVKADKKSLRICGDSNFRESGVETGL